MKKKIVLIVAIVAVMIAVYFFFIKKERTDIDKPSFDRSLGLAEKNQLKENILNSLFEIKAYWQDEPSKVTIDPNTAFPTINQMNSIELQVIAQYIDFFKDVIKDKRDTGELSKLEKELFRLFGEILEKYQINESNGLNLLIGT